MNERLVMKSFYIYACVCLVCVCVCEREREGMGERINAVARFK